jgi:hypothetical protein
MKGTVYSGIVCLSRHPNADVHGQLRCAVRTTGLTSLTSILRLFDISFSPILFNYGIWCESKSQVEITATEKHYGEALVCPTWAQYLKVEDYQPIPEKLKRSAGATRAGGIYWPQVGQHLFQKWDGFCGPRRECMHCRNPKVDPIHIGGGSE